MLENEITQEEFNNKMLNSAKETLKILQKKYNKEYQEAITDLNNYVQDMDSFQNTTTREYSETEIQEILGCDTIIDYIDALVDENILHNYFVTDNFGNRIVESAYEVL